ncbi:YHS domain-containing (seleno)protein [Leptolyngbya ectocarpi]|uniref:YHS domain-containing (seleno)protein n=1 Tax=Leptolyngbya ectocarpi TaxID=1202 RepID=UPI001D147F09|nr:YHS domain-containing (seleno)protein [Leptolyngbya ectocarpi]
MYANYLAKLIITLSVSLALAAGCSTPPSTSDSHPPNNNRQENTTDTAATNPDVGVNLAASSGEPITVETSKSEAQDIQYFVDDNGLAIRGTDPVAYFTQGGPVTGTPEFVYTWRNATWQFASAENRDLFVANPEQYAPQYGGFCAWAVSQGYTASIDPNAWKIVDGRLYLNYNRGVQRQWERDIPDNISKANANWPGVLADS